MLLKLTTLPKRKEIHWFKMDIMVKYIKDGSVYRLNAKLVAKGYTQQPNIDFKNTFTHVGLF